MEKQIVEKGTKVKNEKGETRTVLSINNGFIITQEEPEDYYTSHDLFYDGKPLSYYIFFKRKLTTL